MYTIVQLVYLPRWTWRKRAHALPMPGTSTSMVSTKDAPR